MCLSLFYHNVNNVISLLNSVVYFLLEQHEVLFVVLKGVWTQTQQVLYGLLAGEQGAHKENLSLCGTGGLDSLTPCTAKSKALLEQIWPKRLHMFLPGQTPSCWTGACAVMMRSSILLSQSYSMGQEIWLFNPLAAAHDYLASRAEKRRQPKV